MVNSTPSRHVNSKLLRTATCAIVMFFAGCGFDNPAPDTKEEFIFRVELTESASNLLQQQLSQGKKFYAWLEIRKYDSGSGSGGSGGGTSSFSASHQFELKPALPGEAYAAFASTIDPKIGARYGAQIRLLLKVDSQVGLGGWSECGTTYYNGSDYVTWQVN